MSKENSRMLYLKWSQSVPVILLLGPHEERFSIPRDFLTRRSPYFHVVLSLPGQEAATGELRLPETSYALFSHVAIWLVHPDPHVDPDLSFALALDLAIFATRYEISALLNQLMDHLCQLFTNKPPARWTPSTLGRLYSGVPAGCLLRTLVPWTVTTLVVSSPSSVEPPQIMDKTEAWKSLFLDHSDLGYVYFEAKETKKSLTDRGAWSKGECRFHTHAAAIQSDGSYSDEFGLFTNKTCSAMKYEPFQDLSSAHSRSQNRVETKLLSKKERKKQKHKLKSLPWNADQGNGTSDIPEPAMDELPMTPEVLSDVNM